MVSKVRFVWILAVGRLSVRVYVMRLKVLEVPRIFATATATGATPIKNQGFSGGIFCPELKNTV
jgi:hypothetical protein